MTNRHLECQGMGFTRSLLSDCGGMFLETTFFLRQANGWDYGWYCKMTQYVHPGDLFR